MVLLALLSVVLVPPQSPPPDELAIQLPAQLRPEVMAALVAPLMGAVTRPLRLWSRLLPIRQCQLLPFLTAPLLAVSPLVIALGRLLEDASHPLDRGVTFVTLVTLTVLPPEESVSELRQLVLRPPEVDWHVPAYTLGVASLVIRRFLPHASLFALLRRPVQHLHPDIISAPV